MTNPKDMTILELLIAYADLTAKMLDYEIAGKDFSDRYYDLKRQAKNVENEAERRDRIEMTK